MGDFEEFLFDGFRLPDVGEEATIHHEGQDIVINVNMLNDIRKLGFGNYGSVMLVEVNEHPDIKMAVKVGSPPYQIIQSERDFSLSLQ